MLRLNGLNRFRCSFVGLDRVEFHKPYSTATANVKMAGPLKMISTFQSHMQGLVKDSYRVLKQSSKSPWMVNLKVKRRGEDGAPCVLRSRPLRTKWFPLRLGVAVSGGVDSMVLTSLLDQYCVRNGVELFALSVNHGFRPEAEIEMQEVRAYLNGQATGWKPSSSLTHVALNNTMLDDLKHLQVGSLQETAREIRYSLLLHACEELGISHLCVGHQADDQLETFVQRWYQASGMEGLKCIASVQLLRSSNFPTFGWNSESFWSSNEHIPPAARGARPSAPSVMSPTLVLRPMLRQSRKSIQEFAVEQNIPWIEDPTNATSLYMRNRIRQVVSEMPDGDRAAILGLHSLATRSQKALWSSLRKFAMQSIKISARFGYAVVDFTAWRALPTYRHQEAIIERLALVLGSKQHAPRSSRLGRLVYSLAESDYGVDFTGTLGGCVFRILSHDGSMRYNATASLLRNSSCQLGPSILLVHREPPKDVNDSAITVRPNDPRVWDNRYFVHVTESEQPEYRIRFMRREEWKQFREWSNVVPPFIRESLPVMADTVSDKPLKVLPFEDGSGKSGLWFQFRPQHELIPPA